MGAAHVVLKVTSCSSRRRWDSACCFAVVCVAWTVCESAAPETRAEGREGKMEGQRKISAVRKAVLSGWVGHMWWEGCIEAGRLWAEYVE